MCHSLSLVSYDTPHGELFLSKRVDNLGKHQEKGSKLDRMISYQLRRYFWHLKRGVLIFSTRVDYSPDLLYAAELTTKAC